MNQNLKQQVLELLQGALNHIQFGENSQASEKIEAAIAAIQEDEVAPASEEGDEGDEEGKPKDPPLPGTGNNGVIP